MAIFEWKPQYSVGVPELDEQHKVLVRLINELDELLASRFDLVKAQALFRELVDYTIYHFATEERLMVRFQYDEAGYQAHIRQHRQFEQEIKSVLSDIDQITTTD
ncbi:MAG: hemerythrin family protein [Hahellaceae bacterium]|nr:hemerythrin family protein [Hahellaceae bacterium]MCP5170549.1 hemerythrin family protein [Hahellaceae bacterium]